MAGRFHANKSRKYPKKRFPSARVSALVNQSAVLLASYFASGVSQLFRSTIAGALEHGPSKILEQHELKFTVRDLKNMGGDIFDAIPDLIAEGPGVSFQDTKSIQRLFKDYLDIDIPRDEVTNDVSVALALRHVLVHNGGIVDRKCLKQTDESRLAPSGVRLN